MRKQALIAVTMLIGSSIVSAETTAPATTEESKPATSNATTPGDSDTLSKDTWLNTIVPMLPSLICKGFMSDPELKQRLDTIKMSYDQCVSAIPESVSKCQNQLYANIPDKINSTEASTWGKALGECIGKDFAMKYLVPKS